MAEFKPLAYPVLILGLLAVVLAKGCSHIAEAREDAADAKVQLAKADFDSEWMGDIAELELEKAAIQGGTIKLEGDNKTKRVSEIDKRLTELRKDMNQQRRQLEAGKWRKLQNKADTANARTDTGDYWRAWLFVLGSLAIVLALPIIAAGGEGAERWIALALLGILFVSFYLGGVVW
jgi:outer membrane murein-binding lipoprotein Lpp